MDAALWGDRTGRQSKHIRTILVFRIIGIMIKIYADLRLNFNTKYTYNYTQLHRYLWISNNGLHIVQMRYMHRVDDTSTYTNKQ